MKIAAIQMDAVFADVSANLVKAAMLIEQAKIAGAQMVIFPEFFTSAIAFSEKMIDVVRHNDSVRVLFKEVAEQKDIIIGGSLLLFDGYDTHNVFLLFFPNGQVYSHKKDLPTQFENCYYTKGDEMNVLHTPIGNIGVALCWEMLRYDTVKRMAAKVDLILAGSCWWDLPEDAPKEKENLRRYNQRLAAETPVTFARLLKTPVIHSSHCGKATAPCFPGNGMYQTRQFVGAAQIIDRNGTVIVKRSFEQGEGIVFAELSWNIASKTPITINASKYWIPDLPEEYIKAWERNNTIGENYYRNIALPLYNKLQR